MGWFIKLFFGKPPQRGGNKHLTPTVSRISKTRVATHFVQQMYAASCLSRFVVYHSTSHFSLCQVCHNHFSHVSLSLCVPCFICCVCVMMDRGEGMKGNNIIFVRIKIHKPVQNQNYKSLSEICSTFSNTMLCLNKTQYIHTQKQTSQTIDKMRGHGTNNEIWMNNMDILKEKWWQIEREPTRQTNTDKSRHRQTDRQTDWLTDWLTDMQTDWMTDRLADWFADTGLEGWGARETHLMHLCVCRHSLCTYKKRGEERGTRENQWGKTWDGRDKKGNHEGVYIYTQIYIHTYGIDNWQTCEREREREKERERERREEREREKREREREKKKEKRKQI